MNRIAIGLISTAALAAIVSASDAKAAPLFIGNSYQFLDNVSPNSLGLVSGERQQLGSTCVVFQGNTCAPHNPAFAVGTSGIATQDAVGLPLNFIASDLISNHWAGIRPVGQLPTGQWTLSFTNEADQASIMTPSLAGAASVDWAKAVSISSDGTTVTFDWSLPSTPINAVSVLIRDANDVRNNVPSIIYRQTIATPASSVSIDPSSTQFFVPGKTMEAGKPYILEIQLQDLRNDTGTVFFPNVLSQSRTFLAFTAPTSATAAKLYVPMLDTSGPVPVYRFSGVPVEANKIVFLDPEVAIGFDYQVAVGDPNFGSVLLPDGIGDNLYDLWLWDGSDWFDTNLDLTGGQEFSFAAGGVDRFRILGIEIGASIDPFQPGAFITGVSFVADGEFNGTMTPLIVSVPEPATIGLLGLALAGLGFSRRKRSAN